MSVKLEHPDLAQHQANLMRQLREFWLEGHFCDVAHVAVQSREGIQHRAHTAVLAAASRFFKTLLNGSFSEGDQVKRGQPVEIPAADAAVAALLDFIYGGQPEVSVEDSLELLRLADAYELPELSQAIEKGILALPSNDSVTTALTVLRQTQGLHKLKEACEDIVAKNFEISAQQVDFLQLSASQLARLLERSDLIVSQENVVLETIFRWFHRSKDARDLLGVLLRFVDFEAISSDNLLRASRFASSLGPNGDDLQRSVDRALQSHRKRSREENPNFQPKRRCLHHWSPDLGASRKVPGQQVLPMHCTSMWWHQGALYTTDFCGGCVLRWKPSEEPVAVAGRGAAVAGINDYGDENHWHISIFPTGELFVLDVENQRLLSFQDGRGKLLLGAADLNTAFDVCCSPSGVVYILNRRG